MQQQCRISIEKHKRHRKTVIKNVTKIELYNNVIHSFILCVFVSTAILYKYAVRAFIIPLGQPIYSHADKQWLYSHSNTHRHTHTWQIMGPKEHQSLSCNCYLRRLLLKANNGRREYHQVYISVGIMSGCKKSIAIAHTRVGYPNHSCRRRPSYRVSTERKKKFCVPFAVDGIACVPATWTDKGKKTDEWMAWFIMMRDGLSHYLATFRLLFCVSIHLARIIFILAHGNRCLIMYLVNLSWIHRLFYNL